MMPIRGLEAAKRASRAIFSRITDTLTEQTVTEICIIGAGYASVLTPVDTSVLINSQYREVKGGFTGFTGRVGYTAAYAAAVAAASGKLKGLPRPNNRGNYWDPGGEPNFLVKGFERDGAADVAAAVRRGMKI